MKHRSIHIFILLAAVLIAAPQVSQEISALKGAVGRRVKAEILDAFLSLQSVDAARPAAPAPDTLPATCDATTPRRKDDGGHARPATQVEVHARREVPAEVAMLVEPTVEVAALRPEPPAPAAPVAPVSRFETHDEKLARRLEVAMLVPPDADSGPARPALREAAGVKRAAAQRKRVEGLEQQAASIEVRFADTLELHGLTEAEILSRVDALRRAGVDLRLSAPRPQTRVLKVKRAARPAAAPPVGATCPSRQAACGPSAVDSFFAGE